MSTSTQTLLIDGTVANPDVLALLTGIKGARFAGLTYTSKDGETSELVIMVNASYENILRKSIAQMAELYPAVFAAVGTETEIKAVNLGDFGKVVEIVAAAEVLCSLNKSLAANLAGTVNADYTKIGVYETLAPGIKYHKVDGSLELAGLVIHKKVTVPIERKPVKSSEKTLAKREIERKLAKGKYRTYCLEPENFNSVRYGGVEIDAQAEKPEVAAMAAELEALQAALDAKKAEFTAATTFTFAGAVEAV